MTDRYPYRHHGLAVHGSKLADYLISEANMIDDIEQLRAENARMRETTEKLITALDKIEQQADYGQVDACQRIARAAIMAALGVEGE